jgi:hypothetical protein
MKLLTKGLSLIALAVCGATQADSFSAKHAGQGFTGITKDFTSALTNPALLTKYDNDDDVYFSLNLGIIAADEHDVIDNAEDIPDFIDDFSDTIAEVEFIDPSQVEDYRTNLLAQADNITSTLESIDEKPVQLRVGLNALIIVPNKHLSFGLFANQYGRLGIIVDYSDLDGDALEKAINDAFDSGDYDFDEDSLNSSAIGVGYSVIEAGAMFGYQAVKHVNYDISIGTKIKFQRLDLFYNNININDFDEDEFDLTDDDHLTDDDGVNLDLGLYVNWGEQRNWHFALVVNDIAEQEVVLEAQDLTFVLEASAKAGISYQNDWLILASEVDLVERESFRELKATQYMSVGAEFRWSEHMQFRLGARSDLNDVEGDLYTLGLGISPWDVVSFDIAAFKGDNDVLGAALEFGWKI